MDKGTKRRLRRFWYSRLILGVGFLATLGLSAIRLQNYRPPEKSVVLEISQSLETLQDPSLSDKEWRHEYQQLQTFAQANDVRLVSSTALVRKLVQELEQVQKLELELELVQKQDWVQELEREWELEQVQEQDWVQELVQEGWDLREREMERGLTHLRKRELVQELERKLERKRELVQELVQELEQKPVWDREQLRMWAQQEAHVLESILKSELKQKHEQTLMSGVELQQAIDDFSYAQQKRIVLIGSSLLCLTMLLLLLKQRNQTSLSLTGQLICFLPEECVAELGALYQNLSSNQQSVWLVRLIMVWTALELFWAIYIQIKLENLWLPQKGDTSKIDE